MPRVALIHDFLLDLRGAERVFAAICDAWPDADVFTAVYDEKGTEGRFADRHPQASFLQKLRPDRRARSARCCRCTRTRSSRWTCAATTSSSPVLERLGARRARRSRRRARLLLPQPVPLRVVASARRRSPRATRSPARRCASLLSRWRQWDWIAAQRVDAYVANSAITAARIRRYFGRESTVLHPPVELSRFSPGPVGDALPGAGRADGAQAHRRRDPRVQRARAAARGRGRRAGVPAPEAPRRARPCG